MIKWYKILIYIGNTSKKENFEVYNHIIIQFCTKKE